MAKRMIVMIVGIILFLGGAGAGIAGGALMLVFGSDNTLTSGQEHIATPRTAFVAAMDDIKDTNGIASAVGRPTLRLSLAGTGRELFIGIGPAQAVDQYLAGSSVERITDLEADPFKLKTVPRDGSARPAAPATQTFWTARATGPTATLNWKISDGAYRLVIMNADASPAVDASGRVGLTVPHLFAIGLGILIGGVVVGLIGLALLITGVRMRQYQPPAPPVATPHLTTH
jgi:hypothetical protein